MRFLVRVVPCTNAARLKGSLLIGCTVWLPDLGDGRETGCRSRASFGPRIRHVKLEARMPDQGRGRPRFQSNPSTSGRSEHGERPPRAGTSQVSRRHVGGLVAHHRRGSYPTPVSPFETPGRPGHTPSANSICASKTIFSDTIIYISE